MSSADYGRTDQVVLGILHGVQNDGSYRINLWGDIDVLARETSREAVEGFERSGCCEVVVGLAGVRLLDAAGVGFLAELRRMARDRGGRLVLWQPPREVFRVLALTRFGLLVDVVP